MFLSRPLTQTIWIGIHSQGCVVIFLSYFLALMIKLDVAEDTFLEDLGGFLVAVNVLLVLAVVWVLTFAIRQMVGDFENEGNPSS